MAHPRKRIPLEPLKIGTPGTRNPGAPMAAARQKANAVRTRALVDILRGDDPEGSARIDSLRTLLADASADEIADLKRTLRAIQHPVTQTPGADPDTELARDWRQGKYPYKYRLRRQTYEMQKYPLQVELLKLQAWVKETGQRVFILFDRRPDRPHS